jgi:hypothetical protein
MGRRRITWRSEIVLWLVVGGVIGGSLVAFVIWPTLQQYRPPDAQSNLTGNYYLWKEPHWPIQETALIRYDRLLGIIPWKTQVVGPTVWHVQWNDDFIVARQHTEEGFWRPKRELPEYRWFLVRVSSGEVTGPLNDAECKATMAQLGINEPLRNITINVGPPR